MVALRLTSVWSQAADATRKDGRRTRNEDQRGGDAKRHDPDDRPSHRTTGKSDSDENADGRREKPHAGAQDTTSDETVKSSARARNESRRGNDDGGSRTESDGDGN